MLATSCAAGVLQKASTLNIPGIVDTAGSNTEEHTVEQSQAHTQSSGLAS